MIESLRIISPEDEGIEKNVSLRGFPFAPQKGDRIWISGVAFEVVGREFWTNNGVIDGKVENPAVILRRVR
jgi:hypothetical protein